MKIVHDKDHYEDIVNKLKNVHGSISELSGIMGEISETLYSFNLEGASSIVEDAIDELEDKLGSTFLDHLEELINGMENANESMLELDSNMKEELGG